MSCDDTFSLVSLVSAGLGIGFAPEWTKDLPNRGFELRPVRGVDLKIGFGVAWSKEDPTASRDDIIEYCPVAGSAGEGRRVHHRDRFHPSIERSVLPGVVGPGSRPLAGAMLNLLRRPF